MSKPDRIVILDFGSQFTQLIARRIREQQVYAEIHPFHAAPERLRGDDLKGIVLSGGPASVYDADAPMPDPAIYRLGVPILGICYGLQVLAHQLGGQVEATGIGAEFGRSRFRVGDAGLSLFRDVPRESTAWMSHGDSVTRLPDGFRLVGESDDCALAAVAAPERGLYGLQFHPEVAHTEIGARLLRNFALEICGARANWDIGNFIEEALEKIRTTVGTDKVLCGLSGGVDSSVVALLIHKAIGNQLTCIFVDHGLLRAGEGELVNRELREHFGLNVDAVDARERFLARLDGISDPERKRKIIGEEFVRVFEEEARRLGGSKWLAQGTLYPDVIESVSVRGPSATIKTHHNVGGLPERMDLKLLEPVRELFKDEVREVGRRLGLPEEVVGRHPFPGPGLAIRILGPVTERGLALARGADAIFIEELRANGLYDRIWQAFAVLLPVQSVGVMGDFRTYENVAALRAVTSVDGMTADFADIPREVLGRTASRIVNEVRGINRVVYDIS
ncbi:MAG: GMP synthase (glutamine-hydrolysing), partial [bacterium]